MRSKTTWLYLVHETRRQAILIKRNALRTYSSNAMPSSKQEPSSENDLNFEGCSMYSNKADIFWRVVVPCVQTTPSFARTRELAPPIPHAVNSTLLYPLRRGIRLRGCWSTSSDTAVEHCVRLVFFVPGTMGRRRRHCVTCP